MSRMIKIQMVTDHSDYKIGQIRELEEKLAINFLTNGKALKIHRKTNDINVEKSDEKIDENQEEKSTEKGNKKSKKSE